MPTALRFTVAGTPACCSVEDCEAPAHARGWCNRHYLRWWKHGDPARVTLIRGDDRQRFWSKVHIGDLESCWEFTGARDRAGYGTIWFRGRQARAPRVAWILANDQEIPDGQVVRHACDNPPCVNPRHLSLGTPRENNQDQIERGRTAVGDRNGARLFPERLARGPANVQYQPDGCRNGHAAERRYVSKSGERVCRDCVAARRRRARAKARERQS